MIAGDLGGRRLVAPDGATTRPTSDRVREATFNALGSLGAIEDATVLDLFAGSGALGIEALSRGATRATFVEQDRGALTALHANLDSLGLGRDRAEVIVGDAVVLLGGTRLAGPWDLVLADPPYTFDAWHELLERLDAHVVVCESGAPLPPVPGWTERRAKRYGSTVVSIISRPEATP